MEEKDFEGLPFYIEITETVVPSEEEEKAPREKMHEVAPSENRKAVTVSIFEKGHEGECLQSLEELRRLLDTAGSEVAAIVTQMRPAPDSRYGVGSGKLQEIEDACRNTGAELVVFDFELSPSQIKSIEDALDCEVSVLDRSMLILDIFASRAQSAEGRLQVELAQLKYTAPRLMGKGRAMSRLGGGIGTRGPGETKLEIDRRRLKTRVQSLEAEIKRLEALKLTQRCSRDRGGVPKCAIVGYTNAGKSTLLNLLTDAGILAEDKLFATLDPTTRQFILPSGGKVLLTDTVGFIRRLPHHLIKAFKSTLDEAVYADVLLIVADASEPDLAAQMEVTHRTLEELGALGKPTLIAFNKCDRVEDENTLMGLRTMASDADERCVFVSALTGEGIAGLEIALEELLGDGKKTVEMLIPHSDGGAVNTVYRICENVEVDYTAEGTVITALCDAKAAGQLSKYIKGYDKLFPRIED